MENNYCKNCKNYYQHYGLDKQKIYRLYCGHCALDVKKRIQPDRKACDAFIGAPPDEEAFVNKEYLSKELLHYVLGLDLLPEIDDASPI